MQAILAFENAPPFAAPFRFFVTAPFFAMLAGVLLMIFGPAAFVSRWAPETLALTHLIALGFMLQVMLGAAIQIMPVVAGANLRRPLALARVVNVLLSLGALALAAAFLDLRPAAFASAAVLLGAGVGLFLLVAGRALAGVPPTGPTIGGLKLAFTALAGVLALGIALVGGMSGLWSLPLVEATNLHAGWGMGAWGIGLLSAVAYVVVPMFQMTPAYPAWLSRFFGGALLLAAVLMTLAEFFGGALFVTAMQAVLVWLCGAFCATTLWLQARSRRARPDATQRLWRAAMLCGLAACALWLSASMLPALGERDEWPLLFGVLVFAGGFMSVIVGMLYKIVPFLIWLHLQNRGQGKVVAPNMKAVLGEAPMQRQIRAHLLACALLAGATLWPEWLARPAGAALFVAAALLAANIFSSLGVYRRHAALVDARLAEAGGGVGA